MSGKANACLNEFLADAFAVPRAAVSLLSGETSQHARVRIGRPDAGSRAQVKDYF